MREAFSNALRLSLAALHGFGTFGELRTSALMLMHRMVEMLSDGEVVGVLSPALPQLLSAAEGREVVEVSRLVNQLVLKFKGKIAHPVSPMVLHLTTATFGHIAQLDAQIAETVTAAGLRARAGGPQSHHERERYALLRSYYGLLHSLVHSELLGVLTDAANAPHVEAALRVLLQVAPPTLTLTLTPTLTLTLPLTLTLTPGVRARAGNPSLVDAGFQQAVP